MSDAPRNEVVVDIERALTIEQHTMRAGLGLMALQRKTELIEYDCKEADCGICLFRVISGQENLSPPTVREADFLKAMRCDGDERLACQCRVFGNIQIRIEGDPDD
ncbi:MAG: (2Fe-2S)-binding protein [Proteobacteria bacterium]|nr:MAG: (2Fe-2S)-binding protein [Pseudomonadota bacterium]